jgi:hypothetical protein
MRIPRFCLTRQEPPQVTWRAGHLILSTCPIDRRRGDNLCFCAVHLAAHTNGRQLELVSRRKINVGGVDSFDALLIGKYPRANPGRKNLSSALHQAIGSTAIGFHRPCSRSLEEGDARCRFYGPLHGHVLVDVDCNKPPVTRGNEDDYALAYDAIDLGRRQVGQSFYLLGSHMSDTLD